MVNETDKRKEKKAESDARVGFSRPFFPPQTRPAQRGHLTGLLKCSSTTGPQKKCVPNCTLFYGDNYKVGSPSKFEEPPANCFRVLDTVGKRKRRRRGQKVCTDELESTSEPSTGSDPVKRFAPYVRLVCRNDPEHRRRAPKKTEKATRTGVSIRG